jgi:hypothetical protein
MRHQHRCRAACRHLRALLWSSAAFAAAIVNVADAMEARVVYRCKSDGVTTFSDRPCDGSAQTYQADDSHVSSYTPNEPASTPTTAEVPRRKHTIRQTRPASADAKKLAAACEHVNDALRDIGRKMRSGYNVREGERLREQKDKLERKRRAGHCR